jgi:hypothetical protein
MSMEALQYQFLPNAKIFQDGDLAGRNDDHMMGSEFRDLLRILGGPEIGEKTRPEFNFGHRIRRFAWMRASQSDIAPEVSAWRRF